MKMSIFEMYSNGEAYKHVIEGKAGIVRSRYFECEIGSTSEL